MFVSRHLTSLEGITAPSSHLDKSTATIMDSATLIQMIQSKSEKGFEILYDRYCGALYGILIKFVKRKDIADDLLQDTFVKIWRHIDGFDPDKGTLYTWMLRIARNQAIDYLRSTGHRNQLLQVEVDLFSLHLASYDVTHTISCEVEYADFKSKAMRLYSKYAEVIEMIFFFGWTHEQTAGILKLPLGTVKTRARKGLSLLRILYQQ
jgi:RNA polymerase sigma-70 factor (ECF subfamily)